MYDSFRYLDCLDTFRNQLSVDDKLRNAGEAMFRILSGETLPPHPCAR